MKPSKDYLKNNFTPLSESSDSEYVKNVYQLINRSLEFSEISENPSGRKNLFDTGSFTKATSEFGILSDENRIYEFAKNKSVFVTKEKKTDKIKILLACIQFVLITSFLLLVAGVIEQKAIETKKPVTAVAEVHPYYEMLSDYLIPEAEAMASLKVELTKPLASKQKRNLNPNHPVVMNPVPNEVIASLPFESFRVLFNNGLAELKWMDSEQRPVSYMVEKSMDGIHFEIIQIVDSKPVAESNVYIGSDDSNAAFYRLVKVVHNENVFQSKVFGSTTPIGVQANETAAPAADELVFVDGMPS